MQTKRRQSFKRQRSTRFAPKSRTFDASPIHFALFEQNLNNEPIRSIQFGNKRSDLNHRWSNSTMDGRPPVGNQTKRFSSSGKPNRATNLWSSASKFQWHDVKVTSSGSWLDKIENQVSIDAFDHVQEKKDEEEAEDFESRDMILPEQQEPASAFKDIGQMLVCAIPNEEITLATMMIFETKTSLSQELLFTESSWNVQNKNNVQKKESCHVFHKLDDRQMADHPLLSALILVKTMVECMKRHMVQLYLKHGVFDMKTHLKTPCELENQFFETVKDMKKKNHNQNRKMKQNFKVNDSDFSKPEFQHSNSKHNQRLVLFHSGDSHVDACIAHVWTFHAKQSNDLQADGSEHSSDLKQKVSSPFATSATRTQVRKEKSMLYDMSRYFRNSHVDEMKSEMFRMIEQAIRFIVDLDQQRICNHTMCLPVEFPSSLDFHNQSVDKYSPKRCVLGDDPSIHPKNMKLPCLNVAYMPSVILQPASFSLSPNVEEIQDAKRKAISPLKLLQLLWTHHNLSCDFYNSVLQFPSAVMGLQ
jgi:hypothetical protein